MNCMNHSTPLIPLIEFSNINENDEFSHSIVLIKGTISNHSRRYGVPNIIILNENDAFDGSSLVTNDGHFKTIIDLRPGENRLTFNYCCVTTRIRLNYNLRRNPKYQLKVYYVICQNQDGNFQSTENTPNSVQVACEKIDLMIQMVQCFYAEMLIENGYKRKTFDFTKCEPFQSKLTIEEARQWSAYELWQYHAKEFVCQEPNDDHKNYKYIGILASTLYANGELNGNAAMGIGDVALFGSGTMYSWPSKFEQIMQCFCDETLVDTTQLLDDSNGRRTFSGCFTTALGGICHEIGHIFDLGHTHDGIMGNDIDYVNRLFVHERFPKKLPSRVELNCFVSQNQNQNQNQNPANIDRRLTSVKKTNTILLKYHSQRNNNLNLLTENCAILINNHKWFNQFESINWDIHFESECKVVYSTLPLIFIEYRTKANGLCRDYHRFDETRIETKYTIPFDKIGKNYDIVALDQNGNIKKISLD